jgi:hypothetical protein
MRTKPTFAFCLFVSFCLAVVLHAQPPQSINDQGKFFDQHVSEDNNSTGPLYTFETQTPPPPETIPIGSTFNFPSRPHASDYKATDYRLVGLPGAINQSVKDFLSGEPNKNWQVYWDNGRASSNQDNYLIAFDNSSMFEFSTGRAFWMIHKGPVSINKSAVPLGLNANQEFVIRVHRGWNLITNPFNRPISWVLVQAQNGITEQINEYKGSSGYFASSLFEPYVGYYYFETRFNPLPLKIPYAYYFLNSQASENDRADWRVNLALTTGEFRDHANSFGIARDASLGLDHFDFRKPRAVAATPSVEFKRSQWDAHYNTFATDIRPEFEKSESWDFEVRTPQHEASQLAFAGIGKIPSEFEVYLIDAGRGRTSNLREDSLYRFTPVAELSKFSVVVGRRTAVQEKLNAVALPKEFILGPSYPNPLVSAAQSPARSGGNPTTSIPITVPISSEIKLKIYNLLGAEVMTLYDGAIEAGRYWFNWDGRNTVGENVATGVYLYQLSTSTGVSLPGKMILLR